MPEVISRLIRDVPNFPKEGILFRDITPLLADPKGLDRCVELMLAPHRDGGIDAIAGIESRGFIFGCLAAQKLGIGFIPIRKPGKLPRETFKASYELEYGTDTVEMHKDAVSEGQRILIVDDLIATGGTLEASTRLIETAGAVVAGCSCAIELTFLEGRKKLPDVPVTAVLSY